MTPDEAKPFTCDEPLYRGGGKPDPNLPGVQRAIDTWSIPDGADPECPRHRDVIEEHSE